MKKIVDFKEFLVNEGMFNFKENKLINKIRKLLLNKDHAEMFLFFNEHKDLVGETRNLSTENMVKKLTELLDKLTPDYKSNGSSLSGGFGGVDYND